MKVQKVFNIQQVMHFPRGGEMGMFEYKARLLKFECLPLYVFTIHTVDGVFENETTWIISEFTTGMKVANGDSRAEAMKAAHDKLTYYAANYDAIMEKSKQVLLAEGHTFPINEFE